MYTMSEKELQIYIDGKFYPKSEAKISVFDHGLLYGDGVFEGIRSYSGTVFKLKEHIDRIYDSAHAIMLEIPLTKEEMINAVLETLRHNKLKDSYIRLVVTRGFGDLGLDPRKCPVPSVIIITVPILKLFDGKKGAEGHGEMGFEGIKMIVSWIRRDAVDATTHEIKSLNYLNSVLSKIEAINAGVDEAIILDKQGFICEATGENIFIIKNKEVITPPASAGALPGITASLVKKMVSKFGLSLAERNVTVAELYSADETFLTGTGAEILPIIEVNKREIGNGKIGPMVKKIHDEFHKITKDPGEGIPIY